MTPDEWVSSPDGQTVVEQMADVYARWRQGITTLAIPDHLQGPYEASVENARLFMPSALLAALRVRRMTACPAGCNKGVASRSERPNGGWVTVKCQTCAGAGVVPGVPLLVDALMEQLTHETAPDDSHYYWRPEEFYRVRVPAAQPEEPPC